MEYANNDISFKTQATINVSAIQANKKNKKSPDEYNDWDVLQNKSLDVNIVNINNRKIDWEKENTT